jgi:hypothetical protein
MRKFLVVLDDSRECLNAMRFAAMRASKTGGGVQILSVIPPEEYQHWIGVGEIMRQEARERIHAHFEVFAKWMRDKQGVDPELVIREGEVVPETPRPDPRGRRDRHSRAGRGHGQGRPRAARDAAFAHLGEPAHPDHHRAGRNVEGAAGIDQLSGSRGDATDPASLELFQTLTWAGAARIS